MNKQSNLFLEADKLVKGLLRQYGVMQNIEFIIQNGTIFQFGYPHSHIGKYTLELTNVTKQELDLAIKFLLENKLAEQTGQVSDFYGTAVKENAFTRLKLKNFNRGIGVNLRNGKVELTYDGFGAEREVREFTNALNDAVKAVRLRNSLQKMRYNTKMQYNKDQNAITLVGVQI